MCLLRVECYIQYGWDQYLVDPDNGMNCRWKLTAINKPDSEPHCLLQSLPHPSDPLWTKHLQYLTMLNYPTIQSEGSLSQADWMKKQQRVLQNNEIRLMATGLKKEVTVITDIFHCWKRFCTEIPLPTTTCF